MNPPRLVRGAAVLHYHDQATPPPAVVQRGPFTKPLLASCKTLGIPSAQARATFHREAGSVVHTTTGRKSSRHEAQEHSAHEEHIWWVDMFFFLGFLLSFLMDKLLDTD